MNAPPKVRRRPAVQRRHLLDVSDFTRDEFVEVLDTAEKMREVLERPIRRVPTLRGTTVANVFYEPSTRTRVSFELAGRSLSADIVNISASGSSVEKGESLYNTALTLQAMKADIIVMRHGHSGAPHFLARHLDSCVINAGDGTHAHPTQAMLDLYTIRDRLGDIEGLRVAIVGDIMHSRVARSNIWGLTTMGASVVLCAPPTLLPLEYLNRDGARLEHPIPPVEIETNVERALDGADVVMVLRLQLERQKGGHLPTLREYSRMYGIDSGRMKLANQNAVLMHPGPMNEGVEIDPEVAHGPQSVVEDQVSNGVAIRMALLYGMGAQDQEVARK